MNYVIGEKSVKDNLSDFYAFWSQTVCYSDFSTSKKPDESFYGSGKNVSVMTATRTICA